MQLGRVGASAGQGDTLRDSWRSSVAPGPFEDTRSIRIRSYARRALSTLTQSIGAGHEPLGDRLERAARMERQALESAPDAQAMYSIIKGESGK